MNNYNSTMKDKLNQNLVKERETTQRAPFLIERSTLFKRYHAIHTRLSITLFGIKRFKSVDELFIPLEKTVAIHNPYKIHYGDYVRIKLIKQNDKQTTQLLCESNICGFCPHILLANDTPYIYHEKSPSSGIFQILPLNYIDFGLPVRFDNLNYGKVSFRLRHANTSRYFAFDRAQNTISLSSPLETLPLVNNYTNNFPISNRSFRYSGINIIKPNSVNPVS